MYGIFNFEICDVEQEISFNRMFIKIGWRFKYNTSEFLIFKIIFF